MQHTFPCFQDRQGSLLSKILRPIIFSFCLHQLALCEQAYGLCTATPFLRVDTVMFRQWCPVDQEEKERNKKSNPAAWVCTSAGAIVSLRLNEVS